MLLIKVVNSIVWKGNEEEMIVDGGCKVECYGRMRGRRPSFGSGPRLNAEPSWEDGEEEG